MFTQATEDARVVETQVKSSNGKRGRGRPKGSYKGKPVDEIINKYKLPNSLEIRRTVLKAVMLEREGFPHNPNFYVELPSFNTVLISKKPRETISINFKIVFLSFKIKFNRDFVAGKCNSRQIAGCLRDLRNKGFEFTDDQENCEIMGYDNTKVVRRGNHHTPEGRSLFLENKLCNLFGSSNPTDVEHRIPEEVYELYSITKPPKLTAELFFSGKADEYYQASSREANQTKERHGCGPCMRTGIISGPHQFHQARNINHPPPCIFGMCQWSNPEKYRK